MKKKFITTISGLAAYKIEPKDLSKKCSKKFACSCNVVDEDSIQIQGDITEFIFDFFEKDYKVPDKYIIDSDEWKEKLDKAKQKEKDKK